MNLKKAIKIIFTIAIMLDSAYAQEPNPEAQESILKTNTYTTFLLVGNSPEKFGLIPRNIAMRHLIAIIASALDDGCAYD